MGTYGLIRTNQQTRVLQTLSIRALNGTRRKGPDFVNVVNYSVPTPMHSNLSLPADFLWRDIMGGHAHMSIYARVCMCMCICGLFESVANVTNPGA